MEWCLSICWNKLLKDKIFSYMYLWHGKMKCLQENVIRCYGVLIEI